jgi:hypothetical protein
MAKEYIGLLLARFDKKEIEKVHPEWLVQRGPVKFLKNEVKEALKKILLEKIYKQAKEKKYEILENIVIRETENSFLAMTIAEPKGFLYRLKKLVMPKITPEEFEKRCLDVLNKFELTPITPDDIQKYGQTNTNTPQ